jgi:tetratricopeptide (TPR) repeat protein
MQWIHKTSFLLLVILNFCAVALCLPQQTAPSPAPDTAYQAKRQRAVDLFDQGKRLEALPLVEELVKANARDAEMLVVLAACLVDHAATLTDQAAAGKERLRARDLLDNAWKLGNTSTLAMNLSQLLKELPEGGAIKFSDNPQVEQVMEAGEAAFSQRNFDEAIKDYSKALELDPKNYTAALFIGNTYDKQNQFSQGAEWYQRAIQLDPDTETAYRYYADMLAKQGAMAKARTMLIHAAVAEPYNRIVWRELKAWAALNKTHINEVFVAVPAPPQNQPSGFHEPPEISTVWQAYRDVSASWKKGEEFKKHFPQEKEYRHSLMEETDALTAAAQLIKKLANDNKTSGLLAGEASLGRLLRLYDANLIEPYVLFSLGDQDIAQDYRPYRAKNRDKLEEYMDKFVVPPIGTSANSN